MHLQLIDDLTNNVVALKKALLWLALFIFCVFFLDRLLSIFLLNGLERYYGLSAPAEFLLVGYSHLVLGVDKVHLEDELGRPVAKYARAGSTLRDRQVMIEHYFSRNPGSVKTVIYGVDSHIFNSAGLSSNSYSLFYPYIDDPVVFSFLSDSAMSNKDLILRRLLHSSRYQDVTLGLAIRGHLQDWGNYKHGKVNLKKLREDIEDGTYQRIEFDTTQIEVFDRTMEFMSDQGVNVILVYIPTLDIYNNIEVDRFSEAVKFFAGYADGKSNITYFDLNYNVSNRQEYFRDPVHLNALGQRVVTGLLAERIRSSGLLE